MDRLSPLDVSFLHLERDIQQLHVGSVLIFEGPAPTYDEVCTVFESMLDRVPRYRQKVRHVPLELARPVWVDDHEFRVRDHLRRTTLRRPGTERALKTLAARLMSQPLDLSRALWETWLVDGLADGRWALVNKAHHAMIDGISGTDIMALLLSPDRHARPPAPVPWTPARQPSSVDLIASAVSETARSPLVLVRSVASAIRSPARAARATAVKMYGLTRAGAKAVRFESVLDGPIGPKRRWDWARADLSDVKLVKNALGGTVNDVILSAITGGFRIFLMSRGESVEGRTVRTMVPVSMRRPDQRGQLGNEVSAVFADLPVGVADPAERLTAVTTQLEALKASGMAVGVDAMLEAAEFVPGTLFALAARVAVRLPQRSISTVTTNVPGPQVPMYLLGHRMTEMFPYIPLGADVRITIGIASYDGNLSCGVTGDYDAVPDLDVLCAGIETSTAELVGLVG